MESAGELLISGVVLSLDHIPEGEQSWRSVGHVASVSLFQCYAVSHLLEWRSSFVEETRLQLYGIR
jgi:hypothetical protein